MTMADGSRGALPLQRVRLVDQVTERLRDMIISGELLPGRPLLQIQLAERLGVSRTPLREAFRILERDGLVRVTNGNQTVEVIEMTPTEIIEIYQLREVLDGLAARLLATAGVPDQVEKRLAQSIATMDEVLSQKRLDVTAYDPAHVEFHLGIMLANPNRRLQELQHIVRISAQMYLPRYLSRVNDGAVDGSNEEYMRALFLAGTDDHKAIFDAIKSGDAAKAESMAQWHIHGTIKAITHAARPAD